MRSNPRRRPTTALRRTARGTRRARGWPTSPSVRRPGKHCSPTTRTARPCRRCTSTTRKTATTSGSCSSSSIRPPSSGRSSGTGSTVTTLADAPSGTGIDEISFLKIDVERAELEVLNGLADDQWAKVRRLAIEVHDKDGRLAGISGLLDRRG
ncbi:FkbM family methyltransferase [Amycolatopsis speibonae]|uniref:FkbM family methyltransferase n=1 Tax=Amycolatopsis speibonae TaxID=1450224 RepID=A0ABV7P5I2_9PSEU